LPHIRPCANISFLVIASMCYAQAQAPSVPHDSAPNSPSVNRRVEVLIRSQFSVPSGYEIVFGDKTKSDIAGYDTLPVTFMNGSKQTTANFLISKDCNTVARLEKFDISKDPALAIQVDGRPIRGDEAAKVEIINFDDLECPYCARLNNELSSETMEHYKGLIKIVYKDYPMEELHPWAMHAAVDANCLADLNSKLTGLMSILCMRTGRISPVHSLSPPSRSWRSTISQIPSARRIRLTGRNLGYA
jgi:hypothetical protein